MRKEMNRREEGLAGRRGMGGSKEGRVRRKRKRGKRMRA